MEGNEINVLGDCEIHDRVHDMESILLTASFMASLLAVGLSINEL